MTKTTVIGLSLLVSNIGFGQTLEERVAVLEEKVAKMETTREGDEGGSKAVSTPQAGVIFSDDFEAGVSNWKQSSLYSFPRKDPAAEIAFHENMRAAKSLVSKVGTIECPEGNRFFTFASDETGMVGANNKVAQTNQISDEWRLLYCISQKEPISLKAAKLPVLKLKMNLLLPKGVDQKKNVFGFLQIGYFSEKGEITDFINLKSFTTDTEGWEDIEIDFSSAPKDRKIHLAVRYGCVDSRISAASGVQLDNVVLIDDGL